MIGGPQGGGTNPITLLEIADPDALANTGRVYSNDVAGRTELMYRDDTGAEIQLTNAGSINIPGGGGVGGSGTANQIPYWTAADTIGAVGAMTDGQIVIGRTGASPVVGAITGTANRVTVTLGAGTVALTGPQDIHTGASPTFAGLTLSGATNQLVLGTTNTVTINSAAPAASRVYGLPDAGGAADIVLTAGAQTLTSKTLTTPTIADFSSATHNHQAAAGGGTLDHGLALTGLTDDDHTIYALLAGRAGGQVLVGGTAASETLTLRATSNATDGAIIFETDPTTERARILGNGEVYIGTTFSPGIFTAGLHKLVVRDDANDSIGMAFLNLGGTASGTPFLVVSTSTTAYGYLNRRSATWGGAGGQPANSFNVATSSGLVLQVMTGDANPVVFRTNAVERFRVLSGSATLEGNAGATVQGGSGAHRLTLLGGPSAAAEVSIAASDGEIAFFGVTPVVRAAATDDIKDALTLYGLLQGTSATPLNLDGGALTFGAGTGTTLSLTAATNQIVLDSDGANTGTITMAALTGSRTWTWPDLTGTVTLTAGAQTLTDKTLTAPVFSGTATGTYTLGGTPTLSGGTLSGTTSVANDGWIARDTNAGLTASTTQSQGQGALTAEINEVATVANANDTVTLPAATAGRTCTIINNGSNTLQIFPASGDNLGSGVDVSTTLVAGANRRYTAYDATNWENI